MDDEYGSELSSLQHECGVFACILNDESCLEKGTLDVANTITLGLTGLQHRGQESAGIVLSKGESLFEPLIHHRGMGLVNQVFTSDILKYQMGKARLGIGHTRYSTMGASERANCQPFIVETTYGQFSVAHNGELVNSTQLKREILCRGVGLSTGTDSEVFTQLLCATPDCGEPDAIKWEDRIKSVMMKTPLSYSLLILYHDRVYAVRDPFGNRPLCIGKISMPKNSSNGAQAEERVLAYVVSSESGAFTSMGATLIRDILPGEIVELRMLALAGETTHCAYTSLAMVDRPFASPSALCIFEYVYFARPDSYLEGQQVYKVRFQSGMILAKESPVTADLVSVIPESATPAALGYSQGSGIPFVEVLFRNPYVGRTFIQPSTHLRALAVTKKFGFLAENFVNKRIVLVDDSIVRGTTIKPLVQLLRQHGAKEVHVRVASPPIRHPCNMGINIPTHDELIANRMDISQLAQSVGADSLCYLSVQGLHSAVQSRIDGFQEKRMGHCNACLTGNYPVPIAF